ncbi:helix-turn-helix transcriptional regulator [Actinoplanes couchii]|uniref:Transcriptional regulator n=1 Tax=Actinoplanes couchii TaxID=403638 RepID=A0ABQ3XKF3_9ACTN|nr:transcriptional regulator [Actinoplanes couchii]
MREFLTTRRAKISPERAGLPVVGTRRVPGLRRGEVAALAGVSVEYYAKLERGSLAGVSPSVLDAIARALQLDDAERAHLQRLAQHANGAGGRCRPESKSKQKPWVLRPALQWSLDAITSPAIVVNLRQDLVAANLLGRAMYADLYADSAVTPNFGRFTFLDSASRRFHPDWNLAADMLVANLRTAEGKDPCNEGLQELVSDLSARSDEFRRRWEAHNVRIHTSGVKYFRHHVVGDLELNYETMDLRTESDLNMTIYAAEPDSATADRLRLLASWAAEPVTPGVYHQ